MLLLSRYLMVMLLFGCPARYATAETKDAPLKEFDQRLHKYADLHNRIDGSLPKVKKEEDPNVILEREKDFATAIRAARPNSAQGDIFIPAVRPILREIIKQETTGAAGKKARAVILGEGNPRSEESEANVKLVVNGPYPSAAPLSTVPPSLLFKLPPLPDAVEYRFVGRHLILWDTKANLIVDILPDAIT
jgi:hypothetical protein